MTMLITLEQKKDYINQLCDQWRATEGILEKSKENMVKNLEGIQVRLEEMKNRINNATEYMNSSKLESLQWNKVPSNLVNCISIAKALEESKNGD